MAAILGREYPDIYASIGVHSGLAPGSARDVASAFGAMSQSTSVLRHPLNPTMGIPLIVFHGARDATVHPANAERLIEAFVPPAATAVVTLDDIQTRCVVFSLPSGESIAESWTIMDAAHAWSGGSAEGSYTSPSGIDASRTMIRFFLEHPPTRSSTKAQTLIQQD